VKPDIKNVLFLDWETFSTIPIKHGVYKYAEKVEGLLLAYALGENPFNVWDLTSEPMPDDLNEYLCNDDLWFCAHNAAFDRVITEKILCLYHDKWVDTLIMAYRHSLPGSLDELCKLFKLPKDKAKSDEGKKLVQLFCKPLGKNRKLRRATSATHPNRWKRFVEYARLDGIAMRELYKKLPDWNNTDEENIIWAHDYEVNQRGFRIDIDLSRNVISALDKEKKTNNNRTAELTDDEVTAATQRDKLLDYMCNAFGISLPDMTKSTLTRRLNNPDLPEPLRELIELRLQSAKVSTRKYNTLLNAVCEDDILRGVLGYCGAMRTGRWNSHIFQAHNMARPLYKDYKDIEIGIDAVNAGCLDLIFDNVNNMCSSIIRSVIIPRLHHKFVVSDYSGVEGRTLPWLAQEDWKIQVYRDIDNGTGYDMYKTTYAKVFGTAPATVTPEQRQLGKVLELMYGYGGGFGASVTFATGFNMDLNKIAESVVLTERIRLEAENYYNYCEEQQPERIAGFPAETFITWDGIKRMWRETNSGIQQFWYDLENAVRRVLLYKETVQVGYVTIDKKGTWLRIRLPSGRYLCYPSAKLVGKTITYMGKDPYTRQWVRLTTYGGKLAENITQAVDRDILAHGLLTADKHNYKTVLHVHDEAVTETPDTSEYTHDTLSYLLCILPTWAVGLPLAAEGFEAYRYRKN
jgi:DNA polymerase